MKDLIRLECLGLSKFYDNKKSSFLKALSGSNLKTRSSTDSFGLKNISFGLNVGTAIGIIGTNGSGKSTLLQLIAGVLQPSSGSVKVDGKIACVLELGSGFNIDFTGRENVYINGSCFGLSRSEIDDAVPNIEKFAEIGDYFDKPVKIYSSGMVARLAFSIIANVNADILVVDEALSVGDSRFALKCTRFIKEFKKRGIVIFVSHDMNSISSICDQCIWIENGEERFFGETKKAIQMYNAFLFGENDTFENSENEEEKSNNLEKINVSSSKIEITDFKFKNETLDSLQHKASSINFKIKSQILIESAVIGFIISNRNGIEITASNSMQLEEKSVKIIPFVTFNVYFEFYLPKLADGDYSISIGVVEFIEGNQKTHLFIQDCLYFSSKAGLKNGLFELSDIKFNIKKSNA